jgi:hypothetical protein
VVEHVVAVYDPWVYGYHTVPYPVVRFAPVYRPISVGFSFSLFGFGYVRYGYPVVPFGYYAYPYPYRPVIFTPFSVGFSHGYRGYEVHAPVVVRRPARDERYVPRGNGRADRDRGYTERRSEPRREVTTREAPAHSVAERIREQASHAPAIRSQGEARTSATGDSHRTAHIRK